MIFGPIVQTMPRDYPRNLRGRGLLAAVSAALAIGALVIAPAVPPAAVVGDPPAAVVAAPPALVIGDAVAAGARCVASPAAAGTVAPTASERAAECLPMARHGAP